LEYK